MQIEKYIEPKEGEGCIYKITNLINGKVYIGQTSNFKHRVLCYKGMHCKGQTKLYRAFKKYGWDSFKMEQIAFGRIGEDLNRIEMFNISSYDSVRSGYNIQNGGNSIGKHSEESKHKMSIAKKNRIVKDSTKEKMRINMLGNKIHLGMKHSEESKLKMSIALTGTKLSEETKHKISKSHQGKTKSEETRLKMKKSQSNRSDYTIAKMSTSAKNREKVECPYCGLVGSICQMKQWHFDNCKHKLGEL